jgi:hypothetical protein
VETLVNDCQTTSSMSLELNCGVQACVELLEATSQTTDCVSAAASSQTEVSYRIYSFSKLRFLIKKKASKISGVVQRSARAGRPIGPARPVQPVQGRAGPKKWGRQTGRAGPKTYRAGPGRFLVMSRKLHFQFHFLFTKTIDISSVIA